MDNLAFGRAARLSLLATAMSRLLPGCSFVIPVGELPKLASGTVRDISGRPRKVPNGYVAELRLRNDSDLLLPKGATAGPSFATDEQWSARLRDEGYRRARRKLTTPVEGSLYRDSLWLRNDEGRWTGYPRVPIEGVKIVDRQGQVLGIVVGSVLGAATLVGGGVLLGAALGDIW